MTDPIVELYGPKKRRSFSNTSLCAYRVLPNHPKMQEKAALLKKEKNMYHRKTASPVVIREV